MLARKASVVAAVMVGFGCAPAPKPVDTAADQAAVKALGDREISLMVNNQLDSLPMVYAADVVAMPPNEPVMTGVPALRGWADAMSKAMTVSGKYTTSDVVVSGDLAVQHYIGEITMTPKSVGGKPVTEHLKGLHVLKRQADGKWLIVQDVWNTDEPAAPAPPEHQH